MVVAEQAGLGDEVDGDDVVGLGPADVPDLLRLFRVVLPRVAAETAIQRLEDAAVGAVQDVIAAVAVHEGQPGAAEELVVAAAAQHPVEAGVFQHAVQRSVAVEVHVRVEDGSVGGAAVDEDTEVRVPGRLGVSGPRIKVVDAGTAEQIVVTAAAEELVVLAGARALLADRAVAPEPVVALQAEENVVAAPAVETVTSRRAGQRVVVGTAVDHADEVVAAIVQVADIERQHGLFGRRARERLIGLGDEGDVVVAEQTGDPELLD